MLIIVLIAILIFILILMKDDGFWISIGCVGLIASVVVAAMVPELPGDYIETTKTFDIKQIQTSQYYETSTDGNKISVFIENEDGTFKKRSFNENDVTFIEDENPQVEIVTKKYLCNFNNIMFSMSSINTKEVEAKITIPELNSEEVSEKNKQQTKSKNKFCSNCGVKVEQKDNYCSDCGTKLD